MNNHFVDFGARLPGLEEVQPDYVAIERRRGLGVFAPRDVALVRGDGATVVDAHGRRYLDCTAAYGVLALGHGHPAVVEALRRQLERLQACPGIFANDARAQFQEQLFGFLPPAYERAFLANSGTEAVECALKVARYQTGRSGVVAAMRGFHGRTMGALSATSEPKYRRPFEPLLAGSGFVPQDDLAALESAVTRDVGAVILEVVQGEGGVRPASPEFLRRAQELARERGALLILDEVQTGLCRAGAPFAFLRPEHQPAGGPALEPDLICLGKALGGGLPLGACVMHGRLPPLPVGAHGSTFAGSPLACAAGRAVLDVLRRDDLAADAEAKGAFFRERLAELPHEAVREVRGRGLLLGVELRRRALPVLKELQQRGVLALPAGANVVRFLPPLTIRRAELERAVQALREALAATSAADAVAAESP